MATSRKHRGAIYLYEVLSIPAPESEAIHHFAALYVLPKGTVNFSQRVPINWIAEACTTPGEALAQGMQFLNQVSKLGQCMIATAAL